MMTPQTGDEFFMNEALKWAELSATQGEVPVGCVVVCEGKIIAASGNEKESLQDPTAHAEVLAVRKAAKQISSWRLTGCTVYSTLEPCLMCAGALLHARVSRLVVGTLDPKTGSTGSLYSVHQDPRMNHQFSLSAGVLEHECSEILKDFFKSRRS